MDKEVTEILSMDEFQLLIEEHPVQHIVSGVAISFAIRHAKT